MVWQKQAEKWAIKAIKARLSAFEIKYNSQILQDKMRNWDWKEESIKTRIETRNYSNPQIAWRDWKEESIKTRIETFLLGL